MAILVTGSAGFIGFWLAQELIKRGNDVIGIDNLSGGNNIFKYPGYTFLKGDLRDKSFVAKAFDGHQIDQVFHLAAYAAEGQSIYSPTEINEINISPMHNLLVNSINNDVKKFVFTSSMAVYGGQTPPFNETFMRSPVDPYGSAKAYCENLLEIYNRTHGLEYTIIRPHNVYGELQNLADPFRNVLGIWMNRIMRGLPPLIYGDGEQTRAFSYVGDAVPAIANALDSKANSRIINVGSDEVVSINKACDMVSEAMGSSLVPNHIDAREEVKYAYSTTALSESLLGYKTQHSLEQGISLMAAWAKEVGPRESTWRVPIEIHKGCPKVWLQKSV